MPPSPRGGRNKRADATRRRCRLRRWRVGFPGAGLNPSIEGLFGSGDHPQACNMNNVIKSRLAHREESGQTLPLIALFMVQRKGTGFVGGLFGPVMFVWFIVIGVLGAASIVRTPAILAAASPLPAISYLWHIGPLAFVVIGGAFLAVTGGEAFYADMGHFGAGPIRFAWFTFALPALTLSYFGQGALLLRRPTEIGSPFYALAPQWAHYGLVVLSTLATVIASQSIISGAYSMTSQAIRLGFLPRLTVIHTTGTEIGQIYVPLVNWALAVATLAAVIGFGSSDALAGAFGIAVSLLMAITTMMATFVALQWGVNPAIVAVVNGSLLALDLLFFASTSTKLLEGGWFPLLIAFAVSFLMITWRKGEQIMDTVRLGLRQSSKQFLAGLQQDPPVRLPGTAAVLGRLGQGVPLMLTQNIRHNHVLYEHTLLVAVSIAEIPRVPEAERATVTAFGEGLTRIELRYGFMETPDVPQGLATAVAQGKLVLPNPDTMTYFTGHETIVALGRSPGMARWREALFAFMHRNAQRPAAYFSIPWSQVMEIGVEYEI